MASALKMRVEYQLQLRAHTLKHLIIFRVSVNCICRIQQVLKRIRFEKLTRVLGRTIPKMRNWYKQRVALKRNMILTAVDRYSSSTLLFRLLGRFHRSVSTT